MVKDLVNNPSRLFWVLHLGGWLAWALFAKYAYTVITLDEVPPRYFAYVMVISAIGMLLTLVLRYLFKALWGRSLWLQGAGLLIGTVAAGYAWMQARSYLYMTFIETREDVSAWLDKMGDAAEIYAKVSYMSTFTVAWFVILAWSALYFGIKYYRVFQEVQRSALKSAAMAHEAQLKMLRYQLNPHFLFNTLNAISTLILEQATADANRMVTRLSSFLRHSLDNDPMKMVTLEQELTALKLYFDIEKVRFEERLLLELDIEDDAYHALIPSLLLQPLVENSIKHAIAANEAGGTIGLGAKIEGRDLLLEVTDTGSGQELQPVIIGNGRGVGLENTLQRLKTLYNDAYAFDIRPLRESGLQVTIRIPYEAA